MFKFMKVVAFTVAVLGIMLTVMALLLMSIVGYIGTYNELITLPY